MDITKTNDLEVVMRMDTDIASSTTFYTDLNGLQMIRRERMAAMPIQGNVYPMPSSAYIDDGYHRVTVMSAQAGGVSSQMNGTTTLVYIYTLLLAGSLEIFLDRRLTRDDGLGVGQGVQDNIPVRSVMKLVIEKVNRQLHDEVVYYISTYSIYADTHRLSHSACIPRRSSLSTSPRNPIHQTHHHHIY